MSYPFADRAAEDERLVAQAGLFDPLTRRVLREAGLPTPRMLVESFAQGGDDAPAWASVVSGVVPLMERFGIAARAEVDPAALASRLLAETLACDGCVISPPMTGVWTRVPAT
jgi:hypothetical protein